MEVRTGSRETGYRRRWLIVGNPHDDYSRFPHPRPASPGSPYEPQTGADSCPSEGRFRFPSNTANALTLWDGARWKYLRVFIFIFLSYRIIPPFYPPDLAVAWRSPVLPALYTAYGENPCKAALKAVQSILSSRAVELETDQSYRLASFSLSAPRVTETGDIQHGLQTTVDRTV